jgi:hypothetical protein
VPTSHRRQSPTTQWYFEISVEIPFSCSLLKQLFHDRALIDVKGYTWKESRIIQDEMFLRKIHAFARKQNSGWLSKKRQMQAAQLSSNEGYLGTSKQREQLQQRSSW